MGSAGVRILAIDDSPFKKRTRGKCLIVGIIGRGTVIEGVISFYVDIDGRDSTVQLVKAVKRTRFSSQIKVIAINGLSLAGLNIVDLGRAERALGMHVLGITRKKPHPKLLARAITLSDAPDAGEKIALLQRLSKRFPAERIDGFYVQHSWDRKEVSGIFGSAIGLLRLANLVARGVSSGESRGRI